MNQMMVINLIKEAIINGVVISAPVLVVAMIVGLIISIFQAITQIQEQTLTFVPKLLAICLTIILCGSFMLNKLIVFTQYIFSLISNIKA